MRKPPRTLEEVPIPPLRGDEHHSMTVLPYLVYYHYGEDGSHSSEYITERQLNGNIFNSHSYNYIHIHICILL